MDNDLQKILAEYQARVRRGEMQHQSRFREMLNSGYSERQYMAPDSETISTSNGLGGNNQMAMRSKYVHPISKAVVNKTRGDLTTRPARFEYTPNTMKGLDVADKFMDILQKTFTQTSTYREYVKALYYLLERGTAITQTIIKEDIETRIKPDGTTQRVYLGKKLEFIAYDPLQVIVDPLADPTKVVETAQWIAVTIGYKSPEEIEEEYGIEIGYKEEKLSPYATTHTYLIIDGYKKELEERAGLEEHGGVKVVEYYRTDGYFYTILDDFYITRKTPNLAGIVGRLPFTWTPCNLDLETPYGRSVYEELRPTNEILSSAINQIADANNLKIKLPTFTFRGLLEADQLSMDNFSFNDIIPLDASSLMIDGRTDIDIRKMIGRIDFQDVTEGAIFLYREALNNIWYLTGLSPSGLSGLQDKQIRVSGAVDLINQSTLRNSSEIVRNIEMFFMNQTARDFARLFAMYKDQFPELQDVDIEIINNYRNIRVVNGSFLPADQMDEIQKAQFIYQMSLQNQTISTVKAYNYYMKALGILPERFETGNPLDILTQEQIMTMLQMAQQQGSDALVQVFAQRLQQLQEQQNG